MKFECRQASYQNPQDAQAVVMLLNAYACDPMGGGQPLPDHVRENLVAALAERSDAFSVLCYDGENAVGLVNCFEGFSTFKCKPLVNIHDVVVHKDYRGQGISHGMLREVERIARARGCCKLTLEVLQGNDIAKASYLRFGFAGFELDPSVGQAMFWEKALD